MPLYNMTADGDLYEASADESDGSGFERSVENVDDVDASGWAEMGHGTGIDNPFVTAGQIRDREQMEAAAQQAADDNRAEKLARRRARNRRLAAYGRSMDSARSEELRLAHMGQDPLLAMAVAQQMSGADFEQQSILSGYGNTVDGRFDIDRTSGMKGMGDWDDFLTNIQSSIESAGSSLVETATSAVTSRVEDVLNPETMEPETPMQAVTAAPARAVAAVKSAISQPLSPSTKKYLVIGGVAAAAIAAVLILKKKK